MDLTFQINIRKRRSERLSCKEQTKKVCYAKEPVNLFLDLPLEMVQLLLSYLNVVDLGVLAMTSKVLCQIVEDYRTTMEGRRKFLLENSNVHSQERSKNEPAIVIHAFFQLGVYMKRTSFLKTTTKRLKHISEYINKTLICKEECGDGRRCIGYYCYGTFIHTMIAGWDDQECYRVMDFVHQTSPVLRYLKKVLASPPGTLPGLELYVRCFYRRAFCDVLRKEQDKAFWLSAILRQLPIIHQARLLQILFLPKTSVGVNFSAVVYERLEVPTLLDLGRALLFLASRWSDDNIISVIDEIIAIPSPWNTPNMAALLLNCGEEITLKVLLSKAINNRIQQITLLSYELLVASVRACLSVEKASRCIWPLIKQLRGESRETFVLELVRLFKDNVSQLVAEGGMSLLEIQTVLEAEAQFTKEVFRLALEKLDDNGNSLPALEPVDIGKLSADGDEENQLDIEE